MASNPIRRAHSIPRNDDRSWVSTRSSMQMFVDLGIPAHCQLAHKDSCQDGEKVAHVHCHHRQHPRRRMSMVYQQGSDDGVAYNKYETPAMTVVRMARGTSTDNRKGTTAAPLACTTLIFSSTPWAVTSEPVFASGSWSILPASVVLPLTRT